MNERGDTNVWDRRKRIALGVLLSGSLVGIGAAAGAAVGRTGPALDDGARTDAAAMSTMMSAGQEGAASDMMGGSGMDADAMPDAMEAMHDTPAMQRIHERFPECEQMHRGMEAMMGDASGMTAMMAMMGMMAEGVDAAAHDAHHPGS